jgi:hypothetical protein
MRWLSLMSALIRRSASCVVLEAISSATRCTNSSDPEGTHERIDSSVILAPVFCPRHSVARRESRVQAVNRQTPNVCAQFLGLSDPKIAYKRDEERRER